jgi:hypothetical protein
MMLFPGRTLKLKYWNAETRIVDSDRANLEQHLKRLGEVEVTPIKSLEGPELAAADLVIVAAQRIPPQDFPQWLGGLKKRFHGPETIWIPAVILADVPFEILSGLLPEAVKDNWYFDILAPAHLSSLPIRVANLLRIRDHLHELKRYAEAVDEVTQKVKKLEDSLKA